MATIPQSGSGAGSTDPLETLIRRAGRRDTVPSQARARVRAAVHHEWKRSLRLSWWRRSAAWSAVAAAVLVCTLMAHRWMAPVANPVIATVTFTRGSGVTLHEPHHTTKTTATTTSSVVATSIIETDAESRLGLQLSDGRQIRLDHATKITISSNALVSLDYGSVFIDSGPATGPFAVVTKRGTVTDIGTQFEVASATASLRVRVRTGRISLDHQGTINEADAGVELSLTADGDITRRDLAIDDPVWNWAMTSPTPYVLTGMTLRAFLDRICDESDFELHLPAELMTAATTIHLHGTLPEATPNQALEIVLPTCGLRSTISGKRLTIERLTTMDGR